MRDPYTPIPMKMFVIFVILGLAASLPLPGETWDPRAPDVAPNTIALQIASADYAVISGVAKGPQHGKWPITVRDRAWIHSVAQQLQGASFEKMSSVLDITTHVSFYDRNGKMLHDLEVFPNRARLDGRDYRVDSLTADTLAAMIKIQIANLPLPAPGAVGPNK
jgi:hypothetical protein